MQPFLSKSCFEKNQKDCSLNAVFGVPRKYVDKCQCFTHGTLGQKSSTIRLPFSQFKLRFDGELVQRQARSRRESFASKVWN